MQKVEFSFLQNVESRSLSYFVCRKPSSTNKVEPEKVKSDDTNEQTMFHQQAETPRQSDPPPQPLQPLRQAIRTNRTADLRMAAWSDA